MSPEPALSRGVDASQDPRPRATPVGTTALLELRVCTQLVRLDLRNGATNSVRRYGLTQRNLGHVNAAHAKQRLESART